MTRPRGGRVVLALVLLLAVPLAGCASPTTGGDDDPTAPEGDGGAGDGGTDEVPPNCRAQQFDDEEGSGVELACTEASGPGEVAEAFPCRNPDRSGLQVEWDLSGGQVEVTVTDDAGAVRFSDTYTGEGNNTAVLGVGEAGSWEARARLDAEVTGTFRVRILCGPADG